MGVREPLVASEASRLPADAVIAAHERIVRACLFAGLAPAGHLLSLRAPSPEAAPRPNRPTAPPCPVRTSGRIAARNQSSYARILVFTVVFESFPEASCQLAFRQPPGIR